MAFFQTAPKDHLQYLPHSLGGRTSEKIEEDILVVAYSSFNESTGFAKAALTDLTLTVIIVMNKALRPEAIRTHALI